MATAKRSSAPREPLSQKPGSDRNEALADLAVKAAAEDSLPPVPPRKLPYHTGRVRDLGGDVRAVVVTPWVTIDGKTMFRGDHVLAKADVVEDSPALTAL